jgi:hypothetical protein
VDRVEAALVGTGPDRVQLEIKLLVPVLVQRRDSMVMETPAVLVPVGQEPVGVGVVPVVLVVQAQGHQHLLQLEVLV